MLRFGRGDLGCATWAAGLGLRDLGCAQVKVWAGRDLGSAQVRVTWANAQVSKGCVGRGGAPPWAGRSPTHFCVAKVLRKNTR